MPGSSFTGSLTGCAVLLCTIPLSSLAHAQATSQTPPALPASTCVLRLDVPEGATVAVDDRDYGTRRELTFEKLVPGRTYTSRVSVRFPDGGEARRIALIRSGKRTALAARAPSRIVYTWNEDDGSKGLRSVWPDGTHPAEIAVGNESGNWVEPVISPDGSKIAVVRAVVGTGERYHRELWVMDIDGSNRQMLIENFGTSVPLWMPDGNRLLFTHVPGPDKAELFTVDLHGRQRQLATEAYNPGLSPDGTRIVFSRTFSLAGGRFRPDLYVMNADGRGQQRIKENATFAQWSPVGDKILFERPWNDVRVMNADGTGEVRLFNDRPGMGQQPRWSPDGAHLASPRASKETYSELYVMRPDGSESRRVDIAFEIGRLVPGSLEADERRIWGFRWSPDGSQLVLVWESEKAFLQGDPLGQLVVCNPDGTGVRILLPTEGRVEELDWR